MSDTGGTTNPPLLPSMPRPGLLWGVITSVLLFDGATTMLDFRRKTKTNEYNRRK
jgi:hypothetical protein